ncbi:MAG: ABC transporter permease [Dehalococcoidales bacterium]|nr:ABC transporter permease [Dehalococcoidales bacterium]
MTEDRNSFAEAPPRVSIWKHYYHAFFSRKIVVVGLVLILINIIAAIFAPWLAPYDPNLPDPENAMLPPSWKHPLGTDTIGRDYLSRMIYGARTSITIGLAAVGVAAALGVTLGLVAGYFGGWTGTIIMRVIDALMAFPMIMLILLIAAILGQGMLNIIVSLGVGMMASYARMVYGQVISVKQNEYVTAARVIGASPGRIMFYHVLPNCLAPVIVMMSLALGGAILAEAGLSFLGIGINPPTPAWGAMVNMGYKYLLSDPLLSIVPGFAIMILVFAFNMVGDGLRDALDPRLRGTL